MQVTSAYPGRQGKERILETYLNLIYYGNGSYGIKAAAANYFGITDLEDLTITQAAFLSALPQAPSFLDPYQNPNSSPEDRGGRGRTRSVSVTSCWARCWKRGTSPPPRPARARTTWREMEPSPPDEHPPRAALQLPGPCEAERILGSLPASPTAPAVRTGGYRIITTLDYELRQEAKRLVSRSASPG